MENRLVVYCSVIFLAKALSPNIIWIMTDDLGYGELSSFGQTNFHTERIDQFAEEGIRFTSAYCGAPLCAPSRAAFMTGRHTGHTKIRGNGKKGPGQTDTPLERNATTVAELLQFAGYYTALVGKWGLGVATSSGSPHLKGFDFFYGEPDQQNAHNYYPPYLFKTHNISKIPQKVILQENWSGELGSTSVLPSVVSNSESGLCLDVQNGDHATSGDIVILTICPMDEYKIDSMMWTLNEQTGLLYNRNSMVLSQNGTIESLLFCVSVSSISPIPFLGKCGNKTLIQKWFLSSGNLLQSAQTGQCLGFVADGAKNSQSDVLLTLMSCELSDSYNQLGRFHFHQDPPSRDRCMSPITDSFGNRGGCSYTHDLYTSVALDLLTWRTSRAPTQPFFLFLSWTNPHAGGWTSDDVEAGNPVPSDGVFSDHEEWPTVEQDHASVIQNYIDRDVQRLIDRLKSLGIDNNTIVFFASDNGASNEGGHDANFFKSSGPLRGFKRSLYEGGIRTPSSVRWPGHILAGQTIDFPWYFPDFMPTALDIAGRKDLIPSTTDGVSILPLLLGASDVPRPHDSCLYFEFCTNGLWGRAARKNQWKAVALSSKLPTELYDVTVDIGEEKNVARLFPDIVRDLEACMEAQHVDNEDWPRGDGLCGGQSSAVNTGRDIPVRHSKDEDNQTSSAVLSATSNTSFLLTVISLLRVGFMLGVTMGVLVSAVLYFRERFYFAASSSRYHGHQVLSQVDIDVTADDEQLL